MKWLTEGITKTAVFSLLKPKDLWRNGWKLIRHRWIVHRLASEDLEFSTSISSLDTAGFSSPRDGGYHVAFKISFTFYAALNILRPLLDRKTLVRKHQSRATSSIISSCIIYIQYILTANLAFFKHITITGILRRLSLIAYEPTN